MKIFHRAKSDPPENARRSETVRVNFSGRNRICDAVPVAVIVSRKIVVSGITDWLPCYPGQVNISRLLEVIAMAVSNTIGFSIKRCCITGVQELCQSTQIRLRSNQPRVSLCACSAAEGRSFCCKHAHRHAENHHADCQSDA